MAFAKKVISLSKSLYSLLANKELDMKQSSSGKKANSKGTASDSQSAHAQEEFSLQDMFDYFIKGEKMTPEEIQEQIEKSDPIQERIYWRDKKMSAEARAAFLHTPLFYLFLLQPRQARSILVGVDGKLPKVFRFVAGGVDMLRTKVLRLNPDLPDELVDGLKKKGAWE